MNANEEDKDLTKIGQVTALAKDFELQSVDFLTRLDQETSFNKCSKVVLQFSNGTIVTMTKDEARGLHHIKFKMSEEEKLNN